MNANVLMALGMMWKGMLGIIIVMALLAIIVYLLTKVAGKKN